MKKRRLFLLAIVALLVFALVPSTAMAEPGDVLNFKIYLIDKESYALPGYIVTVDNNVQGISNEHGVLSIEGVPIAEVDTFKLYSPEKELLGAFNMSYVNGDGTVTSVGVEDNNYELLYRVPSASVYMYMLFDNGGAMKFHPVDASDNPLEPGKTREKPRPTATPTASTSPTQAPKPTTKPAPEIETPQLAGFVVDKDLNPLVHAGVISVNDEKGGSLSVTTDEEGWFVLPSISTGQHSLYISPEQGDVEDSLDFNVVAGDTANLVQRGDNELEMVIPKTGGVVYTNLMAIDGNIEIIEVSNQPLAPPTPANPEPEPTAEAPSKAPTEAPTAVAQTEAPTAALEEPTAVVATATPTAQPQQQSGGISEELMAIIIVAIISVAVILIVVIVVRSKSKRG